MSRSLIQVANPSTQAVAVNSIIQLGSVQRRFGCNCRLSGNAVEVAGEGYYTVSANVTVDTSKDGFRLPSEIEWEYAARGANPNDETNWKATYAGSESPDGVSWYSSK